jgi:Asp-tRNA(Asn)/Glu-tRNA(Gln) amidotransferase A subunit family amidase
MAEQAEFVTGTYDPRNPQVKTFFDARRLFIDGADSPRDYLERCLSVIDEREPTVQAWVTLNIEGARAAADDSNARYKSGTPISPIDGMPVGIKDVLQTNDMPTTLGSPIFKDRHTGMDSASVNALRLAGAAILGKTVTTEFAFMVPGPTTNPYAATATPGGSSSGSAAAVGAGMVPAALGNQVVGSVIRPAGFCANFAIKPTLGALHGGEGLSLSQLHLGVHAASLEDMWSVAYEIAQRGGADPGYPGLYGPQAMAPAAMPKSMIVLETEGWPTCDATTKSAFHELLDQLSAQGVSIFTRKDHQSIERLEQSIDDSNQLCRIICSYELRWALRAYQRTGLLSPQLGVWLQMAEELGQDDYRDALQRRDAMRADLEAVRPLAAALFTLSSPGPAPRLGFVSSSGEPSYGFVTGSPSFNSATSALGAPTITMPLLAISGMPVGVQIIGHPHSDWPLSGHARWMMNALQPVIR